MTVSIKFILSRDSSANTPASNGLYEIVDIEVDEQIDVYISSGVYGVGLGQLEVYLNGLMQYVDFDYTETSETSIRFNLPLKDGDKVLFIVRLSVNQSVTLPPSNQAIYHQEIFINQDSQSVVHLPSPYVVGTKTLQVYVNGLLQIKNYSYEETDANTLTFTSPLEKDWAIVVHQD